MPSRKPTAGGSQPIRPSSSDLSMAGSRSDQTEAAIITPAAKPVKIFCIAGRICPRIRYTMAAPDTVPMNGIINPQMILPVIQPSP